MLATDAYLAKLEQTIASLKAWTGFIADVASVETSDGASSWRLVIRPKAPQACPVELLLRHDQLYDIAGASEVYEDQPADDLELFLPLLEAVAEGRVVTRTEQSKATGAVYAVETRIAAAAGRTWVRRRELPAARLADPEQTVFADRHYTPYR